MLHLAAFADEISPNLDLQIQTCKDNQITHFELRGVAGKNVMDFDETLRWDGPNQDTTDPGPPPEA